MMSKHVILSSAVATMLFAGFASTASAQRGNEIDSVRIDVHLDANYWGGFGTGARVEIPIIRDVVNRVHDEMAITPGIDFLFAHFYYYRHPHDDFVVFPFAVWQWNFYFGDWSLYPELGFGVWIGDYAHHWHRHDPNVDHAHVWPEFVGGFGARYHFNDDIALSMRVSWPVGLQIGLAFDP
jgi:hypothetical protein